MSPRRKVELEAVPVALSALDAVSWPPPAVFVWLCVALVKPAIVGVIKVSPANVVAVAPKEIDVEPTVTELFVRALLPMFVRVFEAPLIVLFVSVCVVEVSTHC